jgi:iron only hydrogenase large subunit-like protein
VKQEKKTTRFLVQFDTNRCSECVSCVRACPTQAIRVREGKSIQLVGDCIGCGECIRVCPSNAVKPMHWPVLVRERDPFPVAIPSPVLYTQFPGVLPDDLHLALKESGFRYVLDLFPYIQRFQRATVEHILRSRRLSVPGPRPLISPVCPVVIRLVAHRFPKLLSHILPLKAPLALIDDQEKKQLEDSLGIPAQSLHFCYITPCPAELVAIGYRLSKEVSTVDHVLGINDLYANLVKHTRGRTTSDLRAIEDRQSPRFDLARSLNWGMSGGEISGTRIERSLAVHGLKETITYLEKIEMGLFKEMEYIEFRTCPEGCLGGTLTAIDKYIAKGFIHKMLRIFGTGLSLHRDSILEQYEAGLLFSQEDPAARAGLVEGQKVTLSLNQYLEIESLLEMIDGKNCSACGSPGCRVFAEDVVRGTVSLDHCLLLRARGNVREIAERLRLPEK